MDSTRVPIFDSRRSSGSRRSLPWVGATVIAAPLGILLHELGHYLAGCVMRFPGLAFHYASVTSKAEELGFPDWQLGVQAAAGPVVTLLIVLLSCVCAARWGVRTWTVVPAFAAGARSVMIGLAAAVVLVVHPRANGNFDEAVAARSFNLPVLAVVAASTLPILAAWVFLIRRLPASERRLALMSMALAAIATFGVYLAWAGPALLP